MLKTITKIGIGLLFALLVSGCYSVKNFDKLKCITFKDTDCYMRKLYMVKNKYDGQQLVSKDSLSRHSDSILSEVQYLLIKKDIVIYLTTTPSKYVYDKTDTYLIGGRYPNAYYLNAMYIGKALPDAESENIMHFSFENQKAQQDWEMRQTPTGWRLVSLDERKLRKRKKGEPQARVSNTIVMKPRNSFLHPIEFERVPDLRFRYRKPLGYSDYESNTGNLKTKVANKTNTEQYAQCICLHVKEGKQQALDFGVLFFDFTTNKFFSPEHVPFFTNFESEPIMVAEPNTNPQNTN